MSNIWRIAVESSQNASLRYSQVAISSPYRLHSCRLRHAHLVAFPPTRRLIHRNFQNSIQQFSLGRELLSALKTQLWKVSWFTKRCVLPPRRRNLWVSYYFHPMKVPALKIHEARGGPRREILSIEAWQRYYWQAESAKFAAVAARTAVTLHLRARSPFCRNYSRRQATAAFRRAFREICTILRNEAWLRYRDQDAIGYVVFHLNLLTRAVNFLRELKCLRRWERLYIGWHAKEKEKLLRSVRDANVKAWIFFIFCRVVKRIYIISFICADI